MTLHQNPRGLEMATSSVPKFPVILRKTKEKDFRKPPKIEVTMNKRFLYKPYTMMNGDDLPELKRLEHTELADKTRSRNNMEKDRCWRNINLSFRDHQYAMAGLRQEQSLVYQFMCKVQKDKRRIQRQVHKRRELEFQSKMRWERIKDACRYVVFKFRENARKKKQARLSVVNIKPNKPLPVNKTGTGKQPQGQSHIGKSQLVESKLAKRPQLEMISDAHEDHPVEQISETSVTELEESKVSNPVKHDTSGSQIDPTKIYTKSKTESDMLLDKTVLPPVRSGAFETFRNGDKDEKEINHVNHDNQEGVKQEENGVQAKSRVKAKVVQVRKDKTKQPLTKDILETDLGANNHTIDKSPPTPPENIQSFSASESPTLPKIQADSSVMPSLTSNSAVSHERTRRAGIVNAPEVVSTNNYSNLPSEFTSEAAVSDFNDVKEMKFENSEMCHEANQKHKAERESLAMILKKRKKARAKKDLENLNKESFVKYERTKSGFLKAFPGKREDFLPPTNKDLHNRQKLLRQERDLILRQRMKLHRFYNDVIELRDRVVVHESPPEEPEVVQDKELPLLEDTLSQMTNSIFNTVQAEQPELQDGEANRYVRVYEKVANDQEGDYGNTGRRMSSWNM